MANSIYKRPEIMAHIRVISEDEESKYDEIPLWSGEYENATEKALLIRLDRDQTSRKEPTVWVPFSHLRQASDGLSIYASNWIMKEKGLIEP